MVYFVATPIGNLADISLRALETLRQVDIIACEDTRTSQKLLGHYDIHKQLISHHKHNEKSSAEGIIALAKEGKQVAVISDSGMPVISDPGETLAARLRQEEIPFTIIPGANAALSALVLSGMNASQFCFVGFLPEKAKECAELLAQYCTLPCTLLFYLSPHNLQKDIETLHASLGARKACLVKEISKMFEQTFSFVLGEEVQIDGRGEFVLVVEGAKIVADQTSHAELKAEIDLLIEHNMSQSDAVRLIAKKMKLSKNDVYKIALKEK